MENQRKIINDIRINALVSIYKAKSGHPGGVLSAIEVLYYLFKEEMSFDINNLEDIHRDRFILSKGHCAPALYAVAAEIGIINKDRLHGLRKLGHELQGHTHRGSTPWAEASTGSLGQGFSFALGEAYGFKMQGINNRVYVMLGDGELQEGEIWEGMMFAGHHKISNLCAIVDYNKMQSDDLNANIIGLEPLNDKFISFNWDVIEIDGHNFVEIEKAFNFARKNKTSPTIIISHTMKGRGVSFMEEVPTWHGSLELSNDDLRKSLTELGCSESKIEEYIIK